MAADYFEYHAPYQVHFTDSLEALVRRLLESGEESITPSLHGYLEFLDVHNESDFQWLLERDAGLRGIVGNQGGCVTLEQAGKIVRDWSAQPWNKLEWNALRALVFLNTGGFESPLSVLSVEPGNSIRLTTTEETRALFGTEQPTRAILELFKNFSSSRWNALIDLLGFENRGQARGITLYNETGQPLEYFIFGYTND